MLKLVAVGLLEVKLTSNQDDVLVTYSLGSCVGVAMWDPVTKVGGMIHAVLPGTDSDANGAQHGAMINPATAGRFVVTGVPYLAEKMRNLGCGIYGMKTWVAGGAHVLKGITWPGGDIGAANVKAALEALKSISAPEPRLEVGQDYGRTMKLYISSGKATVSSVGKGERDI